MSYPFTTWTGYNEPSIGYVSAIGHMINYWHYRRTETTLEQVYLHGMMAKEKPQSEIMKLAWSWIAPPELQMPGEHKSSNDSVGQYNRFTYDQSQKAYVIARDQVGPDPISFALDAIYDDSYLDGTMWLVNPAFVVSRWNDDTRIQLTLDGSVLVEGSDYRTGFESSGSDRNLVIWLNRTIDLNSREDHIAEIKIIPWEVGNSP